MVPKNEPSVELVSSLFLWGDGDVCAKLHRTCEGLSNLLFKLDDTVDDSIKRVIVSTTDIFSWMNFCTTLAEDDLSRSCHLSIGQLETKSLRDGISTVTS